jgi:hypothetical protein
VANADFHHGFETGAVAQSGSRQPRTGLPNSNRCLCFAPFEKGGYGGFALDLALEQKQIPLGPPFSKGEAVAPNSAPGLPNSDWCFCFAPFEKGGYGGFALDLALEQKQIPLDPPFQRGGSCVDSRTGLPNSD